MAESISKEFLGASIQSILDKVHTNPEKRKINYRKVDRISFACPICGDSSKDSREKRGHLFLNNLYYKCYNEDCRSTFTKLCKDYNVYIDPTMKMDIINYIDTNFQLYHKADNDWFISNFEKLITMDDLEDWFKSGRGPLRSFKKVEFGSAVYAYLLNRGIPKELIENNFYEGIKETGKWSEAYVVFVNKIGDKVIGMQERNLKSGQGMRRFKIWSFKDIYESVYETELNIEETISYNKLSYLYNILNINFEKTITIFEGYIDSIFMPNSVGAVGINTDFGIFTQNELDIRFFFDNDDVGKRKSNKWLKSGFKVFLWEKYINHLAKGYSDPHAFKRWFNNNIKDMNSLMKELPVDYRVLNEFFSTSTADTVYLNYEKLYKKKKEVLEKNIHNYIWRI